MILHGPGVFRYASAQENESRALLFFRIGQGNRILETLGRRYDADEIKLNPIGSGFLCLGLLLAWSSAT
jgi:hypothetical protein